MFELKYNGDNPKVKILLEMLCSSFLNCLNIGLSIIQETLISAQYCIATPPGSIREPKGFLLFSEGLAMQH